MPQALRDAFIASEDRRFEWHPGVDPLAMARAASSNVKSGRVVSGASTLTQQLARLLVPRRRTLAGKAHEALWALRLTAHLSREDILRAYLDRVALGHDLVGVEAAAQAYFGRPACTLSVGQAALLAAIARSPARVDPWRDPEGAARAMREVLGRMRRAGRLDAEPGADRLGRGPGPRPAHPPVRRATSGGGPRRKAGGRRARPRGGGPDHARPGAPARRRAVGALRARRRPAPRPGGGARRRQRLGRRPGLCRVGRLRGRRARGPERRGPRSPPAGQRAQALRLRARARRAAGPRPRC